MKVALCINQFLPEVVGGAEVHVRDLAANLEKKGHRVLIISKLPQSKSSRFTRFDGIPVYRFEEPIPLSGNPIQIAKFMLVLLKITLLLLKERIEVVHAHMASQMCAITRIAAWLSFKKYIITEHGGGLEGFISTQKTLTLRSKIGAFIIGRISYSSKTIIVVHKEMTSLIKDSFGKKSRIVYVPNAVDLYRFAHLCYGKHHVPHVLKGIHENGDPIVMSLGRLIWKRGVHFLIQSFPAVLAQVKNAKLVIIGDGEIRNELEELAKKVGISRATYFIGTVSNDDVPQYLYLADVVVIPVAGIAILETMAMGKCLIAADFAGVSDLIENGESGLLIDLFNYGGRKSLPPNWYSVPTTLQEDRIRLLSEAIISLLANENERRRIEQNAKRRVETNFNWIVTSTKIEQLYAD